MSTAPPLEGSRRKGFEAVAFEDIKSNKNCNVIIFVWTMRSNHARALPFSQTKKASQVQVMEWCRIKLNTPPRGSARLHHYPAHLRASLH
eukprot:4682572-Amphidinium_carterae.1